MLRDNDDSEDYNYRWQINGNGNKSVYGVQVVQGTFQYDVYQSAFGEVSRNFSKAALDEFVKKGWCTYKYGVADFKSADTRPSDYSFVILDDAHCPVRDITAQTTITFKGTTSVTFKGVISKYRYFGFTSMPKYLFGTDDHEHLADSDSQSQGSVQDPSDSSKEKK